MQLLLPEKTEISSHILINDSRDDDIAYRVIIRGEEQRKVADIFNITQSRVAQIKAQYLGNEKGTKSIIRAWEKETSISSRRKALQVINSIKEKKIPEGSKAQTAGILIDKARLIDGESTQNILYADLSDHELDARIEALETEMEEKRI